MTKKEHDHIHSKNMMGDNNPMRRFPEKNYFKKHKFNGSENGNYGGYSLHELENICKKFINKFGRTPIVDEWIIYCKQNNITIESKELLQKYKTVRNFLYLISKECNIIYIDKYLLRSYREFERIKQTTDLDVFFDNGIKVKKHCEYCKEEFITSWYHRERSFCSRGCFNKSEYKRSSLLGNKHAVGNNFKVLKIEIVGEEDVYNGTVDDHHNYYIYVGEDTTKNGRPKTHFINSRNCGETVLEKYGVCEVEQILTGKN
jgi:hypothetical protein